MILGRILAPAVGIVLVLASACGANRHVVRVQTQLQLLNNGLAIRQQKMDRDFEAMTQLMQHNVAALEIAKEKIESVHAEVAASSSQQKVAALVLQLEHLRGSAQEMNRATAEMETRVEAMDEVQHNLFRSATALQSAASYENSNNPAKKPDP